MLCDLTMSLKLPR